jgi:hypothetical protein
MSLCCQSEAIACGRALFDLPSRILKARVLAPPSGIYLPRKEGFTRLRQYSRTANNIADNWDSLRPPVGLLIQ